MLAASRFKQGIYLCQAPTTHVQKWDGAAYNAVVPVGCRAWTCRPMLWGAIVKGHNIVHDAIRYLSTLRFLVTNILRRPDVFPLWENVCTSVHGGSVIADNVNDTVRALGWSLLDSHRVRDDLGIVHDLHKTSTAAISHVARAAWRRRLWKKCPRQRPDMQGVASSRYGVGVATTTRLLRSKNGLPTPLHYACLRSLLLEIFTLWIGW